MIVKKTAVLMFAFCMGFSGVSSAQVLTFKEWKDTHLQTSTKKVNRLRAQINLAKTPKRIHSSQDPNLKLRTGGEAASTADATVERLSSELNNELENLEMAHDLTVTDYFVGYLTKVPNRQTAFDEVAAKLTPQEVSELMGAYANSIVGKTLNSDIAPPASAANFER